MAKPPQPAVGPADARRDKFAVKLDPVFARILHGAADLPYDRGRRAFAEN